MKRRLYSSLNSWRLWTAVFLAGLLFAGSSTFFGVRAVAEALQGATRAGTRGFGGAEDRLDGVTQCCRFTVVAWEIRELTRWVAGNFLLPVSRAPGEGDLTRVQRFFALAQSIASTELALHQASAGDLSRGILQGLQRLREERALLRPGVQRTLAALITGALDGEGLAPSFPLRADMVFPPVAFTIVRPPSVLAVSPRERIKLERSTILQPGLTDQRMAEMEAATEALGWSALVEPTGGYSTYPTIITDTASLEFALQAAAHEWTHTYLVFRPLGFHYFESEEMRTINETVADIVGREISRRLLNTYFGAQAPPPRAARPGQFDFRKEMRQTRLETEALLAQGKVAEAEAYMEERRQLFVRQGYTIRKLNQAYFAFHGTYADSPASVSPIGPQLEALFKKQGSLGQFVRSIESIGSSKDFRRLLDRFGIDKDG